MSDRPKFNKVPGARRLLGASFAAHRCCSWSHWTLAAPCCAMHTEPYTLHRSELLAKKRKRDETQQAQRAAAALQTKKNAKAKRATLFRKAEQFVKEYRQQV